MSRSRRSAADGSVGDGAFYVQRLLDRLCQQSTDCARTLEDICRVQSPKGSSSKKGKCPIDNEER